MMEVTPKNTSGDGFGQLAQLAHFEDAFGRQAADRLGQRLENTGRRLSLSKARVGLCSCQPTR
jgi:hypothetical protein